MRSKLLLAMSTAAVTAASLVAATVPAQAHGRHYGTCVVAAPGARLYPLYSSGCHACSRPPAPRWVRPGRAFRVQWQEGNYLRVSHLRASGWIEYRCLRIVPEDYCIAAGI
jgi:hypothetical protein